MRAADTNLLVRYIINDDQKQADAVERFFEDCRASGEPVFIPVLVVCELLWVLERVYGQAKPELIAALEKMADAAFFQFEQEAVIRRCLEHYRSGKASFADYVIGEISREAGCRDTVTFDRALKGAPGFTLLS
ncbi:MAG TPA: type II toxin-antitoxin system VapC family toxin [Bryobacteraceae bacterium]|nr:type II toxin-antitoxin system VapC family toxin [Bryobacteraceae bacterium]